MLQKLLPDHESTIRQLGRKDLEISEQLRDTGTADFLTTVIEEH